MKENEKSDLYSLNKEDLMNEYKSEKYLIMIYYYFMD